MNFTKLSDFIAFYLKNFSIKCLKHGIKDEKFYLILTLKKRFFDITRTNILKNTKSSFRSGAKTLFFDDFINRSSKLKETNN
jgi:hypothetical protein